MSLTDRLVNLDYQLFTFLNSKFNSWTDQAMFLISSDWFWIPLYGFFIYLLIKRYRNRFWLPLLCVLLGVLFSDQTSNFIKKTVKRPRPSHHLVFKDSVHTVNNYKGGNYGFVSSHAANTFCIAVMMTAFLYFRFRAAFLIISWALLVSYSRIYLGVHFPADILGGAAVGILIGIVLIIIKKRVELKLFSKS